MNTSCNNEVLVSRTEFNLRYIELSFKENTPESIAAVSEMHKVFARETFAEKIFTFFPMTSQQHKIIFGT
ncbi:MAG: hypothetical protein IJB90_04090 [Clostridia bacterium]|nr:hypothetical protein [Clostridia bacterium]